MGTRLNKFVCENLCMGGYDELLLGERWNANYHHNPTRERGTIHRSRAGL